MWVLSETSKTIVDPLIFNDDTNFFLSETPRFFYWIPPNVHLFIGDLLFIASVMKTWGSPMKILGSPMNILGFPMKILRLQWNLGIYDENLVSLMTFQGSMIKKSVSLQWKIVWVFDHNLGVSNENMGTLMKSLGSPMKSLGVFHENFNEMAMRVSPMKGISNSILQSQRWIAFLIFNSVPGLEIFYWEPNSTLERRFHCFLIQKKPYKFPLLSLMHKSAMNSLDKTTIIKINFQVYPENWS